MVRTLLIGVFACLFVLMGISESRAGKNSSGTGGSGTMWFSDPDVMFKGVPLPSDGSPSFIVLDLKALDATFRCCPSGNGGDNNGCQEHIKARVTYDEPFVINPQDVDCRNNNCQFKLRDVVNIDQVANFFEANFCSGGHVIRTLTDPDTLEQYREIYFNSALWDLYGITHKTSNEDPAECTENNRCDSYWKGTADFDPLFTSFADLPMHGKFTADTTTSCSDDTSDSYGRCDYTFYIMNNIGYIVQP